MKSSINIIKETGKLQKALPKVGAGTPHFNVPKEYIKTKISQIGRLRRKPEEYVERRPANLAQRQTVADSDIAEIKSYKPKELKLHPETPEAEKHPSLISQLGGNLTTLFALLPKERSLIREALKEQKLLGATANA